MENKSYYDELQNKQKKLLYRELSQDSQDYLKTEQQYKTKLPLGRKNLIALDDLKQSDAKEKHNNAKEHEAGSKK